MTIAQVTVRGRRLLVRNAQQWGDICSHPASISGEWDPHAGSGWVEFKDHGVARSVAVELVLDGYLEAREL